MRDSEPALLYFPIHVHGAMATHPHITCRKPRFLSLPKRNRKAWAKSVLCMCVRHVGCLCMLHFQAHAIQRWCILPNGRAQSSHGVLDSDNTQPVPVQLGNKCQFHAMCFSGFLSSLHSAADLSGCHVMCERDEAISTLIQHP